MVAFLAVISHFFAMTTDPGSIPPDAEPLPDSNGLDVSKNGEGEPLKPKPRPPKRMCRRCKSYKPDRAHHCSICKRCILKVRWKKYITSQHHTYSHMRSVSTFIFEHFAYIDGSSLPLVSATMKTLFYRITSFA